MTDSVQHAPGFDRQLANWQRWSAAPWGRLRFAVVEETLRRECAAIGEAPLKVLDVGGGDGGDALGLLRAGHEVTILDPAENWLASARGRAEAAGVADRLETVVGSLDDLAAGGAWSSRGEFDLVLCHCVLHYREPAGFAADLANLAAQLRPGGRLSLIAPNPASRVIAALTRGGEDGPDAALREFEAEQIFAVTFNTDAAKVPAELIEPLLEPAGLRLAGRYGARVANDYVIDDDLKDDPDYFLSLQQLELALCDQEPFVRMASLWQLVAQRPALSG